MCLATLKQLFICSYIYYLECPNDRYGQGCKQLCTCKNNAKCHHINGACTCTAGWIGKECGQLCNKGYYGKNCLQICSCENGACDHITGKCTCDKGYIGDR